MSLLNRARKDMQRFVGNTNEFAVECVITERLGKPSIVVRGYHTKHWMSFDPDGVAINTVTASLAVPEQQFIDANFPVRDSNGEVDLKASRIDAPNSNNVVKNYILREVFPDENLGLIILILSEYKEG